MSVTVTPMFYLATDNNNVKACYAIPEYDGISITGPTVTTSDKTQVLTFTYSAVPSGDPVGITTGNVSVDPSRLTHVQAITKFGETTVGEYKIPLSNASTPPASSSNQFVPFFYCKLASGGNYNVAMCMLLPENYDVTLTSNEPNQRKPFSNTMDANSSTSSATFYYHTESVNPTEYLGEDFTTIGQNSGSTTGTTIIKYEDADIEIPVG